MKKKFLVPLGLIFVNMIILLSGCNDTQKSIDVPNDNPVFTCSANAYTGTEPLTVTFTSNLINLDKEIKTYNWSFNDGYTSREQNPVHTFYSAGTYIVTCAVTDIDGMNYNSTVQIKVVGASNRLPTAIATADTLGGEAPLTVSFMGIGFDDDGIIVSYRWRFDDFNGIKTSNEKNPVYTFYEEGSFLVSLTVTDNKGETNTDNLYITVKGKEPKVIFQIDDMKINNYIRIYDSSSQLYYTKSSENFQFVVVSLKIENYEDDFLVIQVDDLIDDNGNKYFSKYISSSNISDSSFEDAILIDQDEIYYPSSSIFPSASIIKKIIFEIPNGNYPSFIEFSYGFKTSLEEQVNRWYHRNLEL